MKIYFTKMVASGNDFVLIDKNCRLPISNCRFLAKKICAPKFGIGADGLLILEKSMVADVKMRIFNADGSEAQMCGNGARCVALYISRKFKKSTGCCLKIKTKAGIINAEVNKDNVRIKLTDPMELKPDIPIRLNNRILEVNFIHTGVPHAVVFVEGLEKIDVFNLGRHIRYHRQFKPAGTNVDFVEVINSHSIKVRTYERGVEGETLACGTGSVASALVTVYQLGITDYGKINVYTQSREVLKVYFERQGDSFKNVWLEGRAKIVYTGCWHEE
ncbi:MAG: diaminopimelate epimerase [Candidatus Omnitrophica bacterium]|nr:diaminopimelate epimerase [Candidatus Omnitrophota bacterium]